MSVTFLRKALPAAMVAAVSGQALAIEPANFQVGGMTFTPTVKLSESYDDNFREVASPDEESSWITTIEPSFVLAAQDRMNVYSLGYRFNSEFYHSSHDDDNTDHFLNADAHMEFTSRSRLDLAAAYSKQEDTGDTTSLVENDKYHSYNVGGVYGYGAESATMQLEFGANRAWKRYDNEGALNLDKERDTDSLSATAYYRVAPKTRALFEVRYNDYDYVTFNTLDSDSMAYLLGLTWDATARTTGTAKIGYEEKDFDDAARKDPSATVWEVGVSWQPRSYSTFTLNTRQGIDEGSVEENFIETTTTSLNWNHAWSSYLSTDVNFSHTEEDYDNVANRQDEKDSIALGLNYEMRRWLSLGLGYKYTERDSNVAAENFDRNLVQASATLSF
ncbi:outer membrane beta-barrel protein [Marinobacterium rhizophilum]|uniref:Outer membrane beta-barrel protein n=1 Tax=Marinobacterium rhizophilum TaxID=420402 RepID=A0ABY5HH48_9GAMM|nr:outer membrane beta-barrel protein [Marinobacterium rhizophilum]UTW10622.1 outer membrane beta-barrel protein [Marinobacterium rhizophilum]